ncbi:MAG TPA: DUF4037 domain-containing protein [Pseudonocardia sp.]|nr:DUF4037 domain-containing protein [Pseudonocardia sp.]
MVGCRPHSCPGSSWPAACTATSSARCWSPSWARPGTRRRSSAPAPRYSVSTRSAPPTTTGVRDCRSSCLARSSGARASSPSGSGARLPTAVAGHATAIAWSDGHEGNGVQLTGLAEWLVGRLGVDPRTGFGPDAWLATPTQALAEVTGGAVLHDPADELTAVRRTLAWYPADVWRCVLAGLWSRIAEEEPFVGRAGEVGDVLGSGVLTARLARDLMRICPLLHRRYPPYSKWLGSAFGRLPCAPTLRPAGSDTAPVLLPALPRPRGRSVRRRAARGDHRSAAGWPTPARCGRLLPGQHAVAHR